MNQSKIERFILILYSIYGLCMFLISIELDWESWVSFLMLTDLAVSWFVYIGGFRDYRSRAIIITCGMQISMLLYATHVENPFSALAIFIMFVIITGLYGILDIFFLTAFSALFLLFYHAVITHTIRFTTVGDTIQTLIQLGNVFLVEYVVYYWVRNRNESNVQLLKNIETLKEAERSKDDFLANVSHEIRTPINTICGMSEMVLREEDCQKMKEDVFSIQTAGRNLLSVVSDILDFSELQSGKVELEEEAYNITSTINDIINMSMAKKSEKSIELVVDCDANIPCGLLGDEKKIRRVIMNLVDNAIKFTNDGCVSIVISYRRESYGINLSVAVRDTGIGMKEESLEKLFTSFNQVDTRRNRQEGGIGLGLAISQAIVQKMDGIITVKSRFGKGTMVKFVIPQKVLDERPITQVQNRERLKVAVYIDMEQFEMVAIRDEYSSNIRHMAEQLDVKCQVCRNLAELKRREEHEQFTHIFISLVEYKEDAAYFDGLSLRTKVIIVIDRPDEKYIANTNILRIYKPFYILPIVSVLNGDAEAEQGGKRIRSGKFVAPTAHILVVDDNAMNLKVIEGLLGNYQIKVTTATSGREALEKIEQADYDFVFMDHMMPEMDGVETLHRIRKKVGTYYRKVPVIALTANAIAGTRERFLTEGFADFLEKPIEVSVLERVLKRNLAEEKLIPVEVQKRRMAAAEGGAGNEERPVGDEAPDESAGEKKAGSEEAYDGGEAPEESFAVGDLDVQKGILYCGGLENYQKILERYSERGDENLKQLQDFFEKQDWENYTIAVHGIKSAMLSIGAIQLSEMAKKLEQAGKADDIASILQDHETLAEEYQHVIKLLREYTGVGPAEEKAPENQEKASEDQDKELPVLQDEELLQRMQLLEDAMFALDGKAMLALLAELQNYQYCGTSLREPLMPVCRKVEMSDYMSAMDVIKKLRERLRDNGEGGGQKC